MKNHSVSLVSPCKTNIKYLFIRIDKFSDFKFHNFSEMCWFKIEIKILSSYSVNIDLISLVFVMTFSYVVLFYIICSTYFV